MSAPRLLLISPVFHGYWQSIESAFATLGYETRTFRYDLLDGALAKIRHKALVELPTRLGLKTNHLDAAASAAAVREIDDFRPDRVLVIKGDVFSDAVWDRLSSIDTLLWLLDERRRTHFTDSRLASIGRLVSYSHRETAELRALGIPAAYVPNAFDPNRAFTPIPSDGIVFVGARYPNREAALRALVAAGVPTTAYGRDWSHHPMDRLRTWSWSRPPIPAERDVPLSTAFGLVAGAAATVNIHTDQDGFTYRTFESCGVGGVQLVDRADVVEFYEPGSEVALFESHDELVELARRAVRDRAWGNGLRTRGRARTLAEHTFVHRAQGLDTLWR